MRAAARFWRAAALLSVLLSLAFAVHGAPAVIQDQTLEYAVSYSNIKVGAVEIVIRAENGDYLVTSTAKPSALASLFIKSHITETRFVRRHGVVALDSGSERLVKANERRRSFRVDRAHNRIEFSNDAVYAMQPDDKFEAAAFPLLLMLRPLASIADTRVLEISVRHTREYTYEKPVAETVTVPAGEFACWKITRHRTDRPADTVTVWLNKTDNPVPVKIAVRKKSNLSILVLTGQ